MVDSSDSADTGGPPSPEEFTEDEIERIGDFLARKGAVVLLSELQDGAKRFVALRETLRVSPATVQDRIDEAKEIGLVSEDPDYTGGGGYKRHPLTPKGRVIADELQLTDLARIQKEIWKLEAEFDEHLDEFESSLAEKTSELNDEFARHLHNQL
ncbi:hypothetical protein GCM10028857_26200 [Salinarchaeum chitinilyticum]